MSNFRRLLMAMSACFKVERVELDFAVKNEYVETNGVFVPYNGWSRTDYIELPVWAKKAYSSVNSYIMYSSFYDKDRKPIFFNIAVDKSFPIIYKIDIPANAKYMALSNSDLKTKRTIILSD